MNTTNLNIMICLISSSMLPFPVYAGATKHHIEQSERVPLSMYLESVGTRLGVYFTRETEQKKTGVSALDTAVILEDRKEVSNTSDLIAYLRKHLPNVIIFKDKDNPAVVHLMDASLKLNEKYSLNESVHINYSGRLENLPDAIEKQNHLNIKRRTTFFGYIPRTDHTSVVNINQKSVIVRQVLTNYVPLTSYSRIIWTADSVFYDNGNQIWVSYNGPISKNTKSTDEAK